ncbi:MAG: hypothetical protein ACK2UC_03540 [Anaerolineae bacterium]|jgi:hypothetical protein
MRSRRFLWAARPWQALLEAWLLGLAILFLLWVQVDSAVGIAAVVVAVVVLQSDWGPWYPWTMPARGVNHLEEGQDVAAQLLLGSLGGVLVALLGGWEVTRRDVL